MYYIEFIGKHYYLMRQGKYGVAVEGRYKTLKGAERAQHRLNG